MMTMTSNVENSKTSLKCV